MRITSKIKLIAIFTAAMPIGLSYAAATRLDLTSLKHKVRAASPIATVDFRPVQSRVTFKRGGKVVAPASYTFPAALADYPNGDTANIFRILLDPAYIDPTHQPEWEDFTVEIRGVKVGGVTYSSFGLCKWKLPGKASAQCHLDAAAPGSYQLVVVSRGATLKASKFVIRVSHQGFDIGTNDDGSGRPGITVAAKRTGTVDVPLAFK